MSEKEERILVLKATEDDFIYKHFNGKGFIPRQEAINRMAKALYLFNREDEWYKEHADMYSKYMNKIAEAALNALLTEDK